MPYYPSFFTDPTKATAPGGFQPAYNGFDGTVNTYTQNNNATPYWWKYDLGDGVAKVAAKYAITLSSYGAVFAPTGWTFEGSNNGVEWDELDLQTGVGWGGALERKEWEIQNSKGYRYYRWTMTVPNGPVCIAEFEAMEFSYPSPVNYLCSRGRDRMRSKGISLGKKVPTDGGTSFLIMRHNRLRVTGVSLEDAKVYVPWDSPAMTTYNTPSPYVLSASYDQSSNRGLFAWDRNAGTYWGTSGGGSGPQWAKIDCGASFPPIVTGLTVKAYPGYGPKNIILQGGNDDSTWSGLLTTLLNSGGDVQSLSVPNTAPYQFYRLYCTDSYTPGNQATYEISLSGYR